MSKFKTGDRVRAISTELHNACPNQYPEVNTIGRVVATEIGGDVLMIQWPLGSTSDDDYWCCLSDVVELVEDNAREQQGNEYFALKRELDHLRKKAESMKDELAEEKSKVDYLEGRVEAYRWCIAKMMARKEDSQ